jgi:hypothetical protein
MFVDGRMNVIARRVHTHMEVDAVLPRVNDLLKQAKAPTPLEARRLALITEAVGDLSAALLRGQGVDDELHLLQAFCQSWNESIERERAA